MDVDDDARTIGRRLRQIRYARGKSLRVVAGLAGISKSQLSEIERGERALDSFAKATALANALQIAPSELTRLPVPAPGNGHTDRAIEAVRLALMAVSCHQPGGQVVPVSSEKWSPSYSHARSVTLRVGSCGMAYRAGLPM